MVFGSGASSTKELTEKIMIICSQCLPGSYNHHGHTPVCEWPADCTVQWGARGVVLRRQENGGSYNTAFFEAFPTKPKTFIRGEGSTIEEAERSAFGQFEKFQACPNHEFERRNYTNGAGFCKHCGLFNSTAFEPIEPDKDARKSILQELFESLQD